jgi:cytidine deaminase
MAGQNLAIGFGQGRMPVRFRTMPTSRVDWTLLFTRAEQARRQAYAPYSRFHVGAALLADDGTIVAGCNVENASYGLTLCAERAAVGQVVVLGKRPVACAIVVDSREPTPPCGMCRQVLAELGSLDLEVRSRTVRGKKTAKWTVRELLPDAFTPDFL